MDKKIAVKIAEAKVRVAQRKLEKRTITNKETIADNPYVNVEYCNSIFRKYIYAKGFEGGKQGDGTMLGMAPDGKEYFMLKAYNDKYVMQVGDKEGGQFVPSYEWQGISTYEFNKDFEDLTDLFGFPENFGMDDIITEEDIVESKKERKYENLFESAEKPSGKALNEDVNNYTFKDLFGKDFDEVLKIAVEKIAKIPEEHEELGFESVEDLLNSSVESDLFEALEEDAGDEADRIAISVVAALFNKNINLEQYNDLREKLGLDPIEVEKKESVASKKKNESEETLSSAEAKVLKKAIRNTIGHAHYYKEVGQELQDTIDQLLEADAFDTEEEIEAAEKLSKAHYGSVAIKACHVDLKGVSAIKAEL